MTEAGAEVLPFLKGGVVLPCSLLLVAAYTKLANSLSRERLYYVVVLFFLGFFAFFGAFLHPYRDMVQMSGETIAHLKETYPHFQHIFPIFGVWIYTAFYVFAELWGAVVLNLSFWQFANEVTRTVEAKRFYSMFGFIGHLALIAAGYTVGENCKFDEGTMSCEGYVQATIIVVLIAGAMMLSLYYWLHRVVLTDPKYYDGAGQLVKGEARKLKLSLTQSVRYILSSPYLGLIATLVFSYAFTMNLLGIMWKKQLSIQYPTTGAYASFMGNFSIYTGISTVTVIFFFKGIVSRFGWRAGAFATPIILFLTAVAFFSFLFFKEQFTPLMAFMGTTPLMMAVIVSTAQQLLSKSAKYALFDPTKEMAYIPLDQELKIKGKAAVDVTVHQFGKAAGGYVSGALLIILAAADLMVIAPYLAFVILIAIFLWFGAVKSLDKMYHIQLAKVDPTLKERV